MKEYVYDPKEFKDLTKGRIHWTIRQEHTLLTNGMATGERLVILSVTGISKENKNDIVIFELSFGRHHVEHDDYVNTLDKAKSYVESIFSKATRGAWAFE